MFWFDWASTFHQTLLTVLSSDQRWVVQTPPQRISMNDIPTSDGGTFVPTRCIQPAGSGSEGSLSLQTASPRPPKITVALSVHLLYQIPKTEMHI